MPCGTACCWIRGAQQWQRPKDGRPTSENDPRRNLGAVCRQAIVRSSPGQERPEQCFTAAPLSFQHCRPRGRALRERLQGWKQAGQDVRWNLEARTVATAACDLSRTRGMYESDDVSRPAAGPARPGMHDITVLQVCVSVTKGLCIRALAGARLGTNTKCQAHGRMKFDSTFHCYRQIQRYFGQRTCQETHTDRGHHIPYRNFKPGAALLAGKQLPLTHHHGKRWC